MHENWEQALALTSGDFVIFLGDDDGLQPDCLETAARLIAGRDVELLAWLGHTYYWPDVPDAKRRNHLCLDVRSAPVWAEYFAPDKLALDRAHLHESLPPGVFCLDGARLLHNWLAHEGPRVYVPAYHNLVSRKVIDRVRSLTGGTYFFDPLPDFGTLIANLYVASEVFFYAAPLSMTGHAGGSSGGTHGDLESWTRTLERFMTEANVTPEELLPSVFEPFLWAPAVLAGCFENVKARLFPDDDRFEMGWEAFLHSAAGQVNGEPEAVRGACRRWVERGAQRIGVPPGTLAFPDVEPWKRQVGTLVDPQGRTQHQYLDGDRLGLQTVADAVELAAQYRPLALYPTSIPEPAPLQPAARQRAGVDAWRSGLRTLAEQTLGAPLAKDVARRCRRTLRRVKDAIRRKPTLVERRPAS
jgi:hypothetical protein